MIICNRCKIEIPHYKLTKENTRTVTLYRAPGAYTNKEIDLCDKCRNELESFIGKAESYFMVNKENPSIIFDNVKFYETN